MSAHDGPERIALVYIQCAVVAVSIGGQLVMAWNKLCYVACRLLSAGAMRSIRLANASTTAPSYGDIVYPR